MRETCLIFSRKLYSIFVLDQSLDKIMRLKETAGERDMFDILKINYTVSLFQASHWIRS